MCCYIAAAFKVLRENLNSKRHARVLKHSLGFLIAYAINSFLMYRHLSRRHVRKFMKKKERRYDCFGLSSHGKACSRLLHDILALSKEL
jgi:hypothetical protein